MKPSLSIVKTKTLLLAAASLTLVSSLSAQDNTNSPTAPKSDTAPAPTAEKTADVADKKADMTVVVVANRLKESPYQVAGSSVAVTLEEAQRMGAVSLGDTLKYVPGVSVPFAAGASATNTPYATGGEKGINIRGLEENRIAIMTDGIRQPDDFTAGTGGGFPSSGRVYFDPAVFSQVEIFKSASSSLYGSGALGGAIVTNSVGPEDLLGRTITGDAINNTVTFATADSSVNNLIQAAAGNGEWAGSIVYSFRDGNEIDAKGDRGYNPMDYTSHAVIGKVVRKFDAVKLTATVDYYHRSEQVDGRNATGLTNMGPTMSYDYLTADQDNTRERIRGSLGAEITPLDDVIVFDKLNIVGYWQDSKTRTRNNQLTKITLPSGVSYRDRSNHLDYQTKLTGFNVDALKDIDSGFVTQTIQYGLDFSYSEVESEFNRWDNATGVNDPTVMAPSEVFRFGMFASDKITLGEEKRVVLTPSVRVDYYNVNPDNTQEYMNFAGAKAASFVNWSVSPGFTGMYRVTNDINLYGLYAMGTRNPAADELNGSFTHSGGGMTGGQYRTVPNPNLKDETSNNFEFGLQGNTEHHAFRIAGFYNMYDDFIESMYNTGVTDADGYELLTSRNLEDVEIYGVEVSWDWRVQKQFVGIEGLRAGASFAWTKGKQDTENNGRQPLSSIDPIKVIGYIGYVDPADKWGVRLSATFVAKKSASHIAEFTAGTLEYDPVGSYFLLDLTGFYRINEHWSIGAGINNLLDKEYTTWSSARASSGTSSAGHGSSRYTQPGINGFVSLTATF